MAEAPQPAAAAEPDDRPAAVESFLRAHPNFLAERPGLYALLDPPARVHGEWHQTAGHRVWQYEFDRPLAPQSRAQHSTELAYVFGNFREKSGMVTGRATDVDRALSVQLRRYWTNFAKRGDPNGPGVPEWPAYDAPGARYQVFTMAGDIATADHQRGAIGDLFRELLNRP